LTQVVGFRGPTHHENEELSFYLPPKGGKGFSPLNFGGTFYRGLHKSPIEFVFKEKPPLFTFGRGHKPTLPFNFYEQIFVFSPKEEKPPQGVIPFVRVDLLKDEPKCL